MVESASPFAFHGVLCVRGRTDPSENREPDDFLTVLRLS